MSTRNFCLDFCSTNWWVRVQISTVYKETNPDQCSPPSSLRRCHHSASRGQCCIIHSFWFKQLDEVQQAKYDRCDVFRIPALVCFTWVAHLLNVLYRIVNQNKPNMTDIWHLKQASEGIIQWFKNSVNVLLCFCSRTLPFSCFSVSQNSKSILKCYEPHRNLSRRGFKKKPEEIWANNIMFSYSRFLRAQSLNPDQLGASSRPSSFVMVWKSGNFQHKHLNDTKKQLELL